MANITETETWDDGVYQLETTDPVEGGADGVDNAPHKNLANRTLWLKNNKADKNGNAANKFKVANATATDEAVSKLQMENFVNGQTNFVEKKKDVSGDIDLALTGGIYAYSSSLTSLPSGAGTAGSLFVSQGINTTVRNQLLISSNGNMFFRYGDNGGWSSWEQLVGKSDFVQSLATEGCQKLPSGLILQWGVTTSGTSGIETFPIAFPNACFGVQITNNSTNNSGYVSTFSTTNFSWSNLEVVVNRYFAIGY